MKITEKILTRLFNSKPIQTMVQEDHETRMQEQTMPEFAGGLGFSIDPDDDQFRRVSQTTRDKDPLTYERSVNISHWMYGRNGFYKRLIDISLQAISSAGVKIDTEDEVIQEAWTEFWDDPNKGMKEWFYDDMVDVNLSGEADWPIAINPINGDIEFGYIDPLNVKAIKMLPGNVRVPDKLFMKDKMMDEPQSGKVFEIVKNFGGFLLGDLFHFPINKVRNATRGNPALIAVLDQIDMYDQVFFNEGERMIIKKSFIWDVTRKGTQDKDNIEWLRKNFPNGQPPKPGSVRVHNEEEEWNEVAPSMDASDSSMAIKTIRQGVAGGAGFPDFFFGWGGDVNVATAREMTKPTVWMIEWQQKNIVRFLTRLFSFQLQMWNFTKHLESGLVKSENVKWEIKANNVFPRDFIVQAAGLQSIITSIVAAKTSGLLDKNTAVKMLVESSNELGYNLSVNEITDALEGEEKEKDMFGSDIDKTPPQREDLSKLSFEQVMKMSKRTAGNNGAK